MPTSPDVNDPGRAALGYARRGWAVVPVHTVTAGRCSCGSRDCPSPGKHPRVPWAELEHTAPDVAQVEEWWRRWPAANVGVITGIVSGVVVLDVDPRNGGDEHLAEHERAWGTLPATVEVRTGGGGRHLWFRAPATAVPSRVVAPGLDLEAEGSVVVAPPSVHRSGQRYEWAPGRDPDTIALGAAPAWFVSAPAEAVGGGFADRSGDGFGDGGTAWVERTDTERAEFAALWRRVGVAIVPGDHRYLCPFHDDHHPSLHVDADGCRWYCFGCRRGGGPARLRELLGDAPVPRSRRRVTEVRGLPAPSPVTLVGDEPVAVVGESRHQDALLALTGGHRTYAGVDVATSAHLVPDPENPVDPDAIAVVINGRRVGWLSRVDATRYRRVVARTRARTGDATCAARIRGGWDRGAGDVGRFGVVLALPQPDAPVRG